MFKASIGFALLSCLLSHAAFADEGSPVPASRDEGPSIAITVSPLHVFVPMAELTVEARVAKRFGVAVIAGAGTFHDRDTNQRISLFEGGASARYYATGSFRSGLQLGAEALYVHAVTDASSIDVKAAGLGLSPFAGYKWTHRSGLTLEGELGVSFMVARAHAETGQMAKASDIGPLLNLQVGYSF